MSAVTAERVVWEHGGDLITGSSAAFNEAHTYRYLLSRSWGAGDRIAVFVMLNPSTADAFKVDPTVTRCLGFARREGCTALEVLNLFALRSTDPAALRSHPNPVGALNDGFILGYCTQPGALVVAAWGAHGVLSGRDRHVTGLLLDAEVPLRCLGVTKAGAPRHPLYVPAAAPLIPYPPPEERAA